ncbi:hypothetical protein BW737_004415 [Actinomyces ruminis]|uniref:HD domain-containing protein n=2 Tax=Actinomyces ruminis TaxID=1937003 RepID=A0ABX4MGR0_9ACTO|nr:hypothetical protein [Actinomyces ruminis]PHP53220.1 hypothetical protein BW737_004415 [Actinomyces ruminis]
MDVIDAPQWLLPAFVRSAKAVGATAPVEQIRTAGEELVARWTSPDRHFHNLKHVINMLARVDELADESHNPDVMRLAAWYHGCVFCTAQESTYRRNGGEDEVASAAYAAKSLQALGVPDQTVDRVCALILNLKRHNLAKNDIDAQALSDADLGALAVEPQQYKSYREAVREEYAHIPLEDFLRARLAIITRLLDREALFSSPLGARWELPARENLEAEKRHLENKLAQLPPSAPQPHPTGPTGDAEADEQAQPEASAMTTSSMERGAGHQEARGAGTPEQSMQLGGLEAAADAAAVPPESRPTTPARTTSTPPEAARAPRRTTRNPDEVHTTSLESCADELDQLLSKPRPGEEGPTDRASAAEAERAKLAEKLRAKCEEAKALREARTGEFAPITEPILGSSAD